MTVMKNLPMYLTILRVVHNSLEGITIPELRRVKAETLASKLYTLVGDIVLYREYLKECPPDIVVENRVVNKLADVIENILGKDDGADYV